PYALATRGFVAAFISGSGKALAVGLQPMRRLAQLMVPLIELQVEAPLIVRYTWPSNVPASVSGVMNVLPLVSVMSVATFMTNVYCGSRLMPMPFMAVVKFAPPSTDRLTRLTYVSIRSDPAWSGVDAHPTPTPNPSPPAIWLNTVGSPEPGRTRSRAPLSWNPPKTMSAVAAG